MTVPAKKLRRRALRARFLAALTGATRFAPRVAVEGAIAACAPLARWTRFERTTRANLALAFPKIHETERSRIAAAVRRHAARQFASWLHIAATDVATGGWIDDLVEVSPSIARLDDALALGRGAIIATAHLGDWELLAARLVRRGHTGAVVGLRRAHDPSSMWIENARARHGVRTIPQSAPPRELLEVLARGGVLGILCDLNARRLDGIDLPFFGRPARTLTAPAALARASRAPIVPIRCVRRGSGRYELLCDEPLALETHLGRERARGRLLESLNATYERWIRLDPEQWAWHQERWKHGSAGPASLQSADQGFASR